MNIPNPSYGDLFHQPPMSWGLRGDPVLWDLMATAMGHLPLPANAVDMVAEVEIAFETLTGTSLTLAPEMLHVSLTRRENGGMSNGVVSGVFWQTSALSHLRTRHAELVPPK